MIWVEVFKTPGHLGNVFFRYPLEGIDPTRPIDDSRFDLFESPAHVCHFLTSSFSAPASNPSIARFPFAAIHHFHSGSCCYSGAQKEPPGIGRAIKTNLLPRGKSVVSGLDAQQGFADAHFVDNGVTQK